MLIRHSRNIYKQIKSGTSLYHSSRKTSDKLAAIPACYQKKMAAKNNVRIVDLRSDTLSKPTPEMLKAMFEAELGDDVYGEDPTVTSVPGGVTFGRAPPVIKNLYNFKFPRTTDGALSVVTSTAALIELLKIIFLITELEEKAAAMLGKESGLFVSCGTMGNLLAIMVHCSERGSELLCGEKSHAFLFEQGGPAQIAGVQTWPLQNKPDGTFDLDEMEEKIRDHSDDHEPKTSLIIVENTQNRCGGKVLPMKWIDDLAVRAKELGIPLHMDGARLFNASVYLKISASRIVRDFASATFCISKGLGAPIGAVLVGDKEFIRKSRRLRKALGGGMRQVGVIAAAGIVALDSMIDRLEEDHVRAKAIAKAIADSGSKIFQVDCENLHTNILMININHEKITSKDFCDRLAEATKEEVAELGNEKIIIKICPKTKNSARFVTYYEITDADIAATIRKLNYVIKEYEKAQ